MRRGGIGGRRRCGCEIREEKAMRRGGTRGWRRCETGEEKVMEGCVGSGKKAMKSGGTREENDGERRGRGKGKRRPWRDGRTERGRGKGLGIEKWWFV